MIQIHVLFYSMTLSIFLYICAITREKGGAVMSSAKFMHQVLGLHLVPSNED
jgi:hypothetical protein